MSIPVKCVRLYLHSLTTFLLISGYLPRTADSSNLELFRRFELTGFDCNLTAITLPKHYTQSAKPSRSVRLGEDT